MIIYKSIYNLNYMKISIDNGDKYLSQSKNLKSNNKPVKSRYPDFTKVNFNQWFIGIIDAKGNFDIKKSIGTPSLREGKGDEYKFNFNIKLDNEISLSISGIQVLYYIKSNLGIGHIKNNTYYINNIKHLKEIILPILDNNIYLSKDITVKGLLTSKYYNYIIFRESLLRYTVGEESSLKKIININKNKSLNNSNEIRISILDRDKIKLDQSPIWNNIKYYEIKSINDIKDIITKDWLIGYIEIKGNFIIEEGKHKFSISSNDPIIIYSIKYIFHISRLVKYVSVNNGEYKIETCNRRSIKNIINYFKSNNNKILFKGYKNLEFRKWERSFRRISS